MRSHSETFHRAGIAFFAGRRPIAKALLLFLLFSPSIFTQFDARPDPLIEPDRKSLLEQARVERNGLVALADYQKMIVSGIKDDAAEESWFRMGQYYYARGEYEPALRMFDSLLFLFPSASSAPEALFLKGLSLLSLGSVDSAEAVLLKLPEEDPAVYVKSRIVLGILIAKRGQYAQSNGCLEKALKLGDNSLRSTAYFQLRENYKALSNPKLAAQYADKLRNEFPDALETPQMGNPDKTPAPVSEKTITAAAIPKEEFSLQLGAFQNRENAEKLKKKYSDTYGNSDILESKKDNSPLYVVRLGRFKNTKDAESFASLELGLSAKEYKVIKR